MGGGSPRQLNTLLLLLLLLLFILMAVHYTHISKHYVLLLLLTVPMYTMLSKIPEHTIPCCFS